MAIRTHLSQRSLQKLLRYDKRNGLLTWRVDRGHVVKAGDEAGSVLKNGYVVVVVAGETWLAHRLIWFYVTGERKPGRLVFRDENKQNLAWRNILPESEVLSSNPGAAYQRDLRARRRKAINEGLLHAKR